MLHKICNLICLFFSLLLLYIPILIPIFHSSLLHVMILKENFTNVKRYMIVPGKTNTKPYQVDKNYALNSSMKSCVVTSFIEP